MTEFVLVVGVAIAAIVLLVRGTAGTYAITWDEFAILDGAEPASEEGRKPLPVVVPKAPFAMVVGASPFTYTNGKPYPEEVLVRVGTVSTVEVSGDGSAVRDAGATSGIFPVKSGGRSASPSVIPQMRRWAA